MKGTRPLDNNEILILELTLRDYDLSCFLRDNGITTEIV